MFNRILLKLSGEALGGKDCFDIEVLDSLASQIKEITEMGVKVGVVVGGGNIVRGRLFEQLGLDRVKSDYMGMLATVVNALALEAALNKAGVKAKTMSAIKAETVMMFDKDEANRLLDEGYVIIFGGGVGKPYHSTDTGSAQRAGDINAEVILIAKHGTDGVYDSDPNKNPNAKHFKEITFSDILRLNLQVIDSQAAELCVKNNTKAFVFDMAPEKNIVKAVKGECKGTLINN